MGFKKWPIWLKGGLILNIPFLISFIYSFIKNDFLSHLLSIPFIPGFILSELFFRVGCNIKRVVNFSTCPFGLFIILIVCFLFYFLIGAIIGWIIEKIKSRK